MAVRVISGEQVHRLVPMAVCVERMRAALMALAGGDAVQPLRSVTWLPDRRGLLGVMPGYLGEPAALGVKVVTVFPDNHARGLDSHQGAVLLFDVEDGSLTAVIDGGAVTAIRTAAVSAVATDLLARPDAGDLAILGSGAQARTHLEALALVRDLRRVRVWSRQPEHAARFAEGESRTRGVEIRAMGSAREAVADADIICTVTAAAEPVLLGKWVAPGTHVNAVGACTPNARELDTEAVVRSRLFVDWRDSTLNESGDFLIPRAEGAVGDDHIRADLGELLLGRAEGRTSAGDVTVFKSLGLAIEDLAMAHAALARAVEQNVGREVDLAATGTDRP